MAANTLHRVLITGPTFITPRHLELLRQAGVECTRLDALKATENELTTAIANKDGYILGGLERVTRSVIEAGRNLKAICFTGAGWTEFIPAHPQATERGIAITAAPGANSQAVAELTVALIHDRVRNVSYLSGAGFNERIRGQNFRNLTLGIVGAGNIGSKVARILNAAYGTRVLYCARTRNLDLEYCTGARFSDLSHLLTESDVVSLHMSRNESTAGMIDGTALRQIRDGGILINAAFADAVDLHALHSEVSSGRISAALDVAVHHLPDGTLPDFSKVSSKAFLRMGNQSGFNTAETVEVASDIATAAMINLLNTGNDAGVVNPTFRHHQ